MFSRGCRSWCETQLRPDRKYFFFLRRQCWVAPDSRPNYFKDAHELFQHYWKQIETFSILRFHFNNFPLESKWRFLFLFDFLRNINFHYLSTPRLSSAIEAKKGDANVIWISSLILISIYATCARVAGRWQGETLSSIDFAINICHGRTKPRHQRGQQWRYWTMSFPARNDGVAADKAADKVLLITPSRKHNLTNETSTSGSGILPQLLGVA